MLSISDIFEKFQTKRELLLRENFDIKKQIEDEQKKIFEIEKLLSEKSSTLSDIKSKKNELRLKIHLNTESENSYQSNDATQESVKHIKEELLSEIMFLKKNIENYRDAFGVALEVNKAERLLKCTFKHGHVITFKMNPNNSLTAFYDSNCFHRNLELRTKVDAMVTEFNSKRDTNIKSLIVKLREILI